MSPEALRLILSRASNLEDALRLAVRALGVAADLASAAGASARDVEIVRQVARHCAGVAP